MYLSDMKEVKFIADVMLGKLVKWLRVIGIDVLYDNKITDEELIYISNQEKRVLLTRDKRLSFDKRLKEVIFIENELIDEQIKEFFEKTKIRPDKLFSRCIICNKELIKVVDKNEIKGKVPIYTYLTHNDFSICNRCGKVYWKGTHRDNMKKKIDELILQNAYQNNK